MSSFIKKHTTTKSNDLKALLDKAQHTTALHEIITSQFLMRTRRLSHRMHGRPQRQQVLEFKFSAWHGVVLDTSRDV